MNSSLMDITSNSAVSIEDIKKEMYTFIQQHVKRTIPFMPVSVLSFGKASQYTVSVQAGNGIYSIPRKEDVDHTHVEIGFPNFLFSQSFIKEYAQDPDDPMETVYMYVPIEKVVEEFLFIIASDS